MLGLPGYWRLYSPSPIQVLWGSVAGYEDPRILFSCPWKRDASRSMPEVENQEEGQSGGIVTKAAWPGKEP